MMWDSVLRVASKLMQKVSRCDLSVMVFKLVIADAFTLLVPMPPALSEDYRAVSQRIH
jgi:hypothetical protein